MPMCIICTWSITKRRSNIMAKLTKTLQLPIKLVELAKQTFETENNSTAIRSCVELAIMNYWSELPNTSLNLYHLLTIQERRSYQKYSVRIDDYVVDALELIPNQNLSDTIMNAILLTLSHKEQTTTPSSLKLINILGSKWDTRMQSTIKHVTANKRWQKSYETCVGALGIHANFKLSDQESINDDDLEKINLYQCIQQYALEFKCKALKFECTETEFNDLKNDDYSEAPTPNVDRAVRFFILNYFSVRNSGNTYNHKSIKLLYKRLDVIASLSARLQNVDITIMDILDVLREHKRETDALFIVDPIYLDTNVYKNRTLNKETEHDKEFGWDKHLRLAKELRSIKGDFIYFCRITASRHKNRQNELIDTPETLHLKDIEMQGRIDDLYWGYGFYYIDVPLDNGTIERIITSFEFEGSTLYGTESEVQ